MDPKTVEQLQTELEKAMADLKEEREEHSKTLNALQSEQDAHAKTKSDSKKIIKQLNENIDSLSEAKKQKDHFATFTRKEKKYRIAYPKIQLEGIDYTAEEIAANEEVQDKLIESKSGAVIDIEAEKKAKEKVARRAAQEQKK